MINFTNVDYVVPVVNTVVLKPYTLPEVLLFVLLWFFIMFVYYNAVDENRVLFNGFVVNPKKVSRRAMILWPIFTLGFFMIKWIFFMVQYG